MASNPLVISATGGLKELPLVTTIGATGSDSAIPTEQAVREAIVEPLTWHDSVVYVYTDVDTITIQAGGQFVSSDGTAMYAVASNTDVKLSTGLTTGQSEAANTLYFVWGGVDSNGALKFYLSNSASSMPSELVKGRLLRGAVRNDNSSNIVDFRMTPRGYWYVVDAEAAGSDVTEVLDAKVGTSFVDVNCAGFVPAGRRSVYAAFRNFGGKAGQYYRDKDSALSTGIYLGYNSTPSHGYAFFAMVNASGVFQLRNTSSQTTRIFVIGYEL